jgi:hypothetical protein
MAVKKESNGILMTGVIDFKDRNEMGKYYEKD